jgi:acetyltransferase
MIDGVKISKALKGARGAKPVDMNRLSDLLVRFSQLVVALPQIKEIDMNPVMASAENIIALDARVVLHKETDPAKLPKPALRPYPAQYVESWKLNDDTAVTIRPIRAEDEPLMVKFHETLSEETVRMRYFQTLKVETRTAHDRLARVCFTDFDREMAIVAEFKNPASGQKEIMGVGRLSRLRGTEEAEFAVVISDKWQNKGLGTKFLRSLVAIAKAENLHKVTGYVLPENVEMLRICHGAGFHTKHDAEDKVTRVEMDLV